jgi:hypothetical protein
MLDGDLARIRTVVYRTFADEGRAPSVREIARRSSLSAGQTLHGLQQLADRHALVLSRDGDAVRMAHPFSADPMAFVVTPLDGYDDRRWWGGCAWDSFGISAALSLDVRIETACPECGSQISVIAGPQLPPDPGLRIRFPAPAREWWDDVVRTCTAIRMFCNQDHVAGWIARTNAGQGAVTSARTVWRLAQPRYGDRLSDSFAPHATEHNQALLASNDLTGDFWQLP